ncbi:hypothetical protein DXG01_007192 [Tephrocybe rancida]|nr:hypothetical protein DXG01_007192 [Tephrocybe rancida]
MDPPSPPQRPPVELPPELWLLVATYLEDEDIHRALGLNRIFFEKVMARYREVSLIQLNRPWLFMRTIEALGSPVVGNRVESIKLWPSASWYAIYDLPTHPKVVVPKKWSLRSLLRLPQKHEAQQKRSSTVIAHPPEMHFLFTEKLAAVMAASPNLVNVKELTVHWENKAMPLFCPLLRAWLPMFGGNLRSLSLTAPRSAVEAFLPSSITLPCLEDLSISLLHSEPSVLEFINGLQPTLQSLSIEMPVGYNSFRLPIELLETFPDLIKFSLTMPFDAYHFIDPTGFNRFFLRHTGLQELTMLGCKVVCGGMYCEAIHMHGSNDVVDWYERCLHDVAFVGLHSFQLGLPISIFPSAGPLKCFRMLSRSLASVTLIGVRLSFSEVSRLVTALGGPVLKVLSLTIDALSPDLIDLLAMTCPNLDKLALNIERLCRSHAPELSTYVHESEFQTLMLAYERESYSWKLNDLDVRMWVYSVGHKPQWGVMQAISQAVPAIASFAGQGHMRTPFEC